MLLVGFIGAAFAQAPVGVQALGAAACRAELIGFGAANGFLLRRDGKDVFVPFETTVALTANPITALIKPSGIRVTLLDGTTLHGVPGAADRDGFPLETQGAGVLPLLLDCIERIDFAEAELPAASADDDVLCFRRSSSVDALSGEVLAFGRDGVRFRSAAGERTWNAQRDGVVGLKLRTQAAVQTAAAPSAVVTLKDGSRLSGTLTGPGLRLRLCGGATAMLDLARVAVIEPRSAQFMRLSDAAPNAVLHRPFLDGTQLPAFACDRGLAPGSPLQTGSTQWRRGIVLRAYSEASWDIQDRGWRRFSAHVGADAAQLRAGVRATVRVQVCADSIVLWRSDELVAGENAVALDVAIPRGAKALRVIVEHATSRATGACAVIADALLHSP